jgi:hypothetical protein
MKTTTSNSAAAGARKGMVDDDSHVTPANLKRALTNPSISSEALSKQAELSREPGYRAAEAFVRPAPITTAGAITHYFFVLKRCEFNMTIQAPGIAPEDTPTVVFLPEYHYPKDSCVVEVSSGKWEISSDEEETVLIQRLRWWHGAGEQTLRVSGMIKKHNLGDGPDEAGYYDQCNQGAANSCMVM